MLINKYILREISKTLAMITAVLLLISISNRLVVLLARSINSQFPIGAILQALILITPELLATVLPIALFGALIFSISRMYADNEMVVLFSSGFNNKKLIKLNLQIAITLTFIILGCTLYLNPNLNHLRNRIAQEQYASNMHRLITPGKFQNFLNGKVMFYAESIDKQGIINNVFMTIKNNKDDIIESIITAQTGNIKQGILTLNNGNKYSGMPGQKNYEIISFDVYTKELVVNNDRLFEHPEKLTSELLTSSNLSDRVELQSRLAMPCSTIVLAILAIFLSKVKPRSGRFNSVIPALVIFIIYYTLLITTNKFMLQGKAPLYSLWLIHLIFLSYGCYRISRSHL